MQLVILPMGVAGATRLVVADEGVQTHRAQKMAEPESG
jgi:hypothetical protein